MPRKRKADTESSEPEESPKVKGKKAKADKESPKTRGKDKIEVKQKATRGRSSKGKGKKEESPDLETVSEKPGTKPLMNKTATEYHEQDFSSQAATLDGKNWNLKIASWNVGGLKAWIKKGGHEYILHEKPDILCLQETKCADATIPHLKEEGYVFHTFSSSKDSVGHGGIAVFAKSKPLSVTEGFLDVKPEINAEFGGRLITVEFEKYYVINTYVPNSGRGLVTLPKRMRWDPLLREHVKKLDAVKPVILCGDMNVSHLEIDIANPKTNRRNAGFTHEERDSFSVLLQECDLVDTFRHVYPDKTGAYTFWTYMSNARQRNIGWRLDYVIVSQRLVSHVCDSIMRSEVYGSDHCPLVCLLHV